MFQVPVLQDIFNNMCKVAGNHPDTVSHHSDLPYGTYHHPKFIFLGTNPMLTRNTLTRLEEFGIGERLDEITFFDIGCNLGHMSIELARRGARVKAFDCVKERLDVLQQLVDYLEYRDRIELVYLDVQTIESKEFIKKYGMADCTICLAVDGYIADCPRFYDFLSNITNEYCYFESNVKPEISSLVPEQLQKTFVHVKSLGVSKTSSLGRKIYKMDNLSVLVDKTGLGFCDKLVCERKDGTMVKYVSFPFEKKSGLISRLSGCPYIIPMKIQFNKVIMPYKKTRIILGKFKYVDRFERKTVYGDFTKEEKIIMKKQFIEAIQYLQKVHICHRDLLVSNILWIPEEQKIQIIDWEFIEEDIVDEMENRYDLKQYDVRYDPTKTFQKNSVFSCYISGLCVYEFFDKNLCLEDFKQKEIV